jgi:hypothetical protein
VLLAFRRVLVLAIAFGRLGIGVFFGRIAQEKLILEDLNDVIAFGGGHIAAAAFKELIL